MLRALKPRRDSSDSFADLHGSDRRPSSLEAREPEQPVRQAIRTLADGSVLRGASPRARQLKQNCVTRRDGFFGLLNRQCGSLVKKAKGLGFHTHLKVLSRIRAHVSN